MQVDLLLYYFIYSITIESYGMTERKLATTSDTKNRLLYRDVTNVLLIIYTNSVNFRN